jgi:hypothetical protein
MKSFGKYIFHKELDHVNTDELLNAFKSNFIETGCHHRISKKENELILKNEFGEFNYMYKLFNPGYLWAGLGKMTISAQFDEIKRKYLIQLTISCIRDHIFKLLFICGLLVLSIYFPIVVVPFIFIILFSVIELIWFYLRRKFFINTIKKGDFSKNYYNWNEILKNKSHQELVEIADGNTSLPQFVQDLAKNELLKRKTTI